MTAQTVHSLAGKIGTNSSDYSKWNYVKKEFRIA